MVLFITENGITPTINRKKTNHPACKKEKKAK
jgi:hypothetical protein